MGTNINYVEERSGGVYSDRVYRNYKKNYVMPPNSEEDRKASETAKNTLDGVEVAFSPESVDFLKGVAARKEAARAESERIQKELDKIGPFEMTGNAITQFTVFTRKLDSLGFYDNKSDEEVREIEDLLVSMTYGMSGLQGGRMAGTSSGLSSQAARFELESSTAALRKFSEKYLEEEMQESFNSLIDKYYEHNANIVKGYKSIQERFDESAAKVYDDVGSHRLNPLSQKEKMNYLSGKVKNTEEDTAKAVNNWKDCLEMLKNNGGSIDEVFGQMNNILKELASGKNENSLFLKYVEHWNAPVMENAKSYWSKLI